MAALPGSGSPQDFFDAGATGDWSFLARHNFRDFEAKDANGRTVLYLAARAGHLKVVLYCINNGSDVNGREDSVGSTPLHAAAYYGHGKIVQALMGYAPDTSIKNRYGNTAADEAKNTQIGYLIEHPERLAGTNRFFISRAEVPQFCVDASELRERNVSWVPSCGTSMEWRNRVITRLESFNRMPLAGQVLEKQKLDGSKGLQFASNFLKKYKNRSDEVWHRKVIHLYTMQTPLYRTMNNDLNGFDKLSECVEYAGSLRLALRSVGRSFTGACYRSAVVDETDLAVYRARAGNCVRWLQFSSCTRNRAVALRWGGNVLFEIFSPRTRSFSGFRDTSQRIGYGKDVSAISQFPDEEEVLFEDGSIFYVIAVEPLSGQKTHKYRILVQEVTSMA